VDWGFEFSLGVSFYSLDSMLGTTEALGSGFYEVLFEFM
jgi:hypothetical protein